MSREICWISNHEHSQIFKKYYNEINNKNYSAVINLLNQYKINTNWTLFPETWSVEIEKIKLNIQERIYQTNPAEELYLCIINNFLWTFLPAIILFFGTFGNVLSFIVLCSFTGKTVSTFVYLSLLALVDQFVLIFGLLRKWVDFLLVTKLENRSKLLCILSQLFGTSASDLSVWLIVAVTLERTIVISFPFKAHKFIQKPRAIIVASLMTFAIFFINSHFIYTVELVNNSFPLGEPNISMCGISDKFTHFKPFWIVIDAIVYSFLPFVIILILNIIILVKVCQAKKTRESMMTLNNDHFHSKKSEATRQLTMMLLMISSTFLVTTTPIFIVKMIVLIPQNRNKAHNKDISFKEIAISQFADSTAELLMHLNHAMNFYLYCASGNKFRAYLKSLFRKSCRLKCLLNFTDGTTAVPNSLFENSLRMTRNVNNESKMFNDHEMIHGYRNHWNN